jgi:hypothetical protein
LAMGLVGEVHPGTQDHGSVANGGFDTGWRLVPGTVGPLPPLHAKTRSTKPIREMASSESNLAPPLALGIWNVFADEHARGPAPLSVYAIPDSASCIDSVLERHAFTRDGHPMDNWILHGPTREPCRKAVEPTNQVEGELVVGEMEISANRFIRCVEVPPFAAQRLLHNSLPGLSEPGIGSRCSRSECRHEPLQYPASRLSRPPPLGPPYDRGCDDGAMSLKPRAKSQRRAPLHPKGTLRRSASRFAGMAVRDYHRRDWTAYFVHAGTSLEHLAKAYLASIHPSLIADGKSFDSLLHACGRGAHARTPREAMRTIGATDAVNRCGQILPSIANMRQDLDLLIQARNGAVHMGEATGRSAEDSLVALLRASRELLTEGGWDEATYWGQYAGFATTRLAESANAARVRVADRLGKAQVDFENQFGGLDPSLRASLLNNIVNSYARLSDDQQFVKCPACLTDVLADGVLEVDWKPDFDVGDFGEPLVSGEYPEITFFPGALHCRACHLDLDGGEEVEAAGVPQSIEIMDFDTEKLYKDRYADEESL